MLLGRFVLVHVSLRGEEKSRIFTTCEYKCHAAYYMVGHFNLFYFLVTGILWLGCVILYGGPFRYVLLPGNVNIAAGFSFTFGLLNIRP